MPQLDALSWFNQSFTICFSFWFLFYSYYLLILTEDSKLMKFNFKLIALREIFNISYAKQKFYLHNESFLVQLAELISFFNAQKTTLALQNAEQTAYLKKFAPDLAKLSGRLYVELSSLH